MAVAEAGYSGNLSGIDQVVTLGAQNTTAPASVTGISRAACAGGIFGAPVAVSPGGWPVAAGGGFNGADAIEGFVPLAGLGAGSTVRLYVGANPAGQGVADVILSQDGSSDGSAILAAFAGGSPASIPTLHPGALALLALAIAAMTHRRLRRHLPPLAAVTLAVTLGLAGGKGAEAVLVTITPDGNIADWSGIAPAAQDALGDTANGNPANDLAALLLAADGANLYYRVDVAGLAPVDHAPVVAAPTGTATDTTVTETNHITDADGLRNVTYYLYQNDGTTLVGSNTTGSFGGLSGGTTYKMKTTAETYSPVTGAWTLRTSPLAAITTAVTVVDHAPVVVAPTGTATDTTVTEANHITDADGLRNVTYYLYQNDGTTLVGSNTTGSFSGLSGSTTYKMKTTAETYNPVTGAWSLQTSPLATITTAATVVDHAPVVAAPTGAATDTTVTETNHITDADGLRNVTYYLYQNDGTTLVSSNATGAFTGLAASTAYKMKTTAETYNPVSATWTLQTSPLAAIATAAAELPPVMGDVPDQSTPLDVPIANINLASYVTPTNGDPILSYAIASGSLPPGLVLDTASGVISGTPSATGSYTVTVRATDNDGPSNADSITFTVNVVVPGAAPANFTLTNDSGESPSDGITMNQPAASWMTVAGATSYEVSTNGTTWTDVGNVTGYAFGGLADGGYTLQVRAKNGAGTGPAASKAVTLDTTAPTAPAGNEAMAAGETRNISVTFNEAIQSSAAITVNSGTLNSYVVAGNVLTLNYTASGTTGTYNNALSVVATNLAGVASAAVGVNVVVAVDSIHPATPSILINNGDAFTNSTTVSVSITGDTDNVGVTGWFVSDGFFLSFFTERPSSVDIPSWNGLDGLKELYVWTRDAAGNQSSAGGPASITLDQTAPSLAGESFPNLNAKNGLFSGTMSFTENGTHAVMVDSITISGGGSVSVTAGIGTTSLTIEGTAPNTATTQITVVVRDAAGNARTITSGIYNLF